MKYTNTTFVYCDESVRPNYNELLSYIKYLYFYYKLLLSNKFLYFFMYFFTDPINIVFGSKQLLKYKICIDSYYSMRHKYKSINCQWSRCQVINGRTYPNLIFIENLPSILNY